MSAVRNVKKIEQKKTETRKRVAAYCRVSTDSDSQLESLENQLEAFRYQIALHTDWDLVGIYADEGLSGTGVKHRKEFIRMIKDCEAGKIDYIITKSISRFARNTLDCISYVRHLQSCGVQVCFEKEGINTGDAASEMLLTIMASFGQEESRSISENVKWGIRKRFEDGREVKVPLYGFCHTDDALFQIVPDEAEIVREVFERYVHGELPISIMNDMIKRGVKPPAGDSWKRLQLDRMLKNEKYAGDVVLQKTYIENHLSHKQVRNQGELPKFQITDAHPAIVERHVFEQAQQITSMRRVKHGNSTYPYSDMLKCPHCGKPMMHGSLNNFYYNGSHIRDGGWGCYGEGGCGKYLLIQNILDEAIIMAYEEKFGEKKDRVDFFWLDDHVKKIKLGEDSVTIYWRDGGQCKKKLAISDNRYQPTDYADFYNDFLDRVRNGEKTVKYRFLMGLDTPEQDTDECNTDEDKRDKGQSIWK